MVRSPLPIKIEKTRSDGAAKTVGDYVWNASLLIFAGIIAFSIAVTGWSVASWAVAEIQQSPEFLATLKGFAGQLAYGGAIIGGYLIWKAPKKGWAKFGALCATMLMVTGAFVIYGWAHSGADAIQTHSPEYDLQ
jgi:hypothetical protein